MAEAQCVLLRRYIDSLGIEQALSEAMTGEESEVRQGLAVKRMSQSRRVMAAWDALHRCEVRAMNLRSRLGLDPAARARMGRDLVGPQWSILDGWAQIDAEEAEQAAGRDGGAGR